MITFVTHYIELTPLALKKIGVARGSYVRQKMFMPKNPEKILDTLYRSIKKFHPKSDLILLTDATTKIAIDPSIKVIRIPMETECTDYESLKAKIYYLKHFPPKTHIIFLEWDMLLQDNLSHIFESNQDVYLTVRNLYPMPFNDGFIAVRGSQASFAHTRIFFDFLLKHYNNFTTKKYWYWYGLQLILKKIFLPVFLNTRPKKISDLTMEYKGVKIGFLDGKIYNYNSPLRLMGKFCEGKKAVHFSKSKKISMLSYWKKYLDKPGA